MKVKIFSTTDSESDYLEAEMNTFFKENPNIEVIEKSYMSNKYTFWIIIYYKETSSL